MISLDRASYQVQPRYAEYVGLSTDVKPIESIDNGDEFQEIDTGFVYKFDKTNTDWVKQPTGGGGGTGTNDYNDLINLPQINGVELIGNKTSTELNINEVPSSVGALETYVLTPGGWANQNLNKNYELVLEQTLQEDSLINFTFDNYYSSFIIYLVAPDGQTIPGDLRFIFNTDTTIFIKGRSQYENIMVDFYPNIFTFFDIAGNFIVEDGYSIATSCNFKRYTREAKSNSISTVVPLSNGTVIQVWGVKA